MTVEICFCFRQFVFGTGNLAIVIFVSDNSHLELAISQLRVRVDGAQPLRHVRTVPPVRGPHRLGLP